MRARIAVIIAGMAVALMTGCTGSTAMERDTTASAHPLRSMLDQGISQLTFNIAGLKSRAAELEEMPATLDPTLRELRALDLAAWKILQQQWMLQRDHLVFAKDMLQRAKRDLADRPRLLEEWTTHEQRYESALADLRQERHDLERKRFQLEAMLIEEQLK
ncbi:MAG TPA: hypothetical protein VJ692_11575 [Nitrospiraceae bacterium]|nr:hypothetical protein [Nitrospiraceae bacterium]